MSHGMQIEIIEKKLSYWPGACQDQTRQLDVCSMWCEDCRHFETCIDLTGLSVPEAFVAMVRFLITNY